MATKKTTCCICGTEYEVCHFCPEVANFTPWRRICDTSKHYQIYLILSEYNSGVLNKADARKQFEQIQIRPENCTDFRPNIYKVIREIFQESSSNMEHTEAVESDATKYQGSQTNTFITHTAPNETSPKAKRGKKAKRY